MNGSAKHPVWSALGLLLGLGFVLAYWPLFVVAGIIAFVGWVTWQACKHLDARSRWILQRRADLNARADWEDYLWRMGDPRGTYGRFPPAI